MNNPLRFPHTAQGILAVFLLVHCHHAKADVSLPSIFSDHAVLQRTDKTCVWGKADPGEHLTVSLQPSKVEAVAGPDGKWRVALNLSQVKDGPLELIVEGKNRVVVSDVLVGEVWVCSGQSNMVTELHDCTGGKGEVSQTSNPMLRQFTMDRVGALDPKDECQGKWIVVDPKSSGGFSAVSYYFGKSVQLATKKAVGLIFAAWSGTAVESWSSSEALDKDPFLKQCKDGWVDEFRTLPKRFSDYKEKFHAWETQFHREDHPVADVRSFADPQSAPGADWKTVTLSGSFSRFGLPDAGVIWLRRQIPISSAQANKKLMLALGKVYFTQVYWNGTKIDEMTPQTLRRVVPWEPRGSFLVPANLVQFGEATIAIRLWSPAGGAAITVDEQKQPLLVGEWKAKAEYELPPLDESAKAAYPGMPPFKINDESNIQTFQFNGMIHPLLSYAIRGVLWYQGEGNAPSAARYRTSFPMLIKDWREKWKEGDFPFYFCQLPNYGPKLDVPGESTWAELREAQQMTLALPNTGMGVNIDLGEVDIHPSNKKDVGERIANVALAQTYGQKAPSPSPTYDSMAVEGSKVRIRFLNPVGGLKAKQIPAEYIVRSHPMETKPLIRNTPKSQLEGFAICGKDRKWKWADARIDGETVIVESAEVPEPIAVRYAWADNPTCNLYNSEDLPVAPFRTDGFPLKTASDRMFLPKDAR